MWYQTILLKDGGARKMFLCSRWGMIFFYLCEIILHPDTQDLKWLLPKDSTDIEFPIANIYENVTKQHSYLPQSQSQGKQRSHWS